MIQINDELKTLFKSDSVEKYLRVYIQNAGYFENDKIYYESFKLKESIIGNNWEFCGCIASEMSVKIQSDTNFTKSDWKDKLVTAEIAVGQADGTKSEYIPLFYGYIDECVKDSDRLWQTITCYDALYSRFSTTKLNETYATVYEWYCKFFKRKDIKKTIKTFREDLFENQLGIEVILPSQGELPNDNLPLKKHFQYKEMTVLEILQGICQINGVFGKMTRDGKLKFGTISKASGEECGAYPSATYPNQVSPSQPYQQSGEVEDNNIEYLSYKYRGINYQDNLVDLIATAITIRNNSSDSGITVTDDTYSTIGWDESGKDGGLVRDDDEITAGAYIIQGNMFAYKQSDNNLKICASNIYKALGRGIYFREYRAESNGLPYLECGDKVVYTNSNNERLEYIVTNRTLSGIQCLIDKYESSIDSSSKEFITTPQSCVSDASSVVSPQDVSDISKGTVEDTLDGTAQDHLGYMYVVKFEDGVLWTSSGVKENA